ncbi:unnamed protein product [Pedinophyceae sp. YPF-701]|nr:unnamed protein product [Pedinophyceae sp. YPF-701]
MREERLQRAAQRERQERLARQQAVPPPPKDAREADAAVRAALAGVEAAALHLKSLKSAIRERPEFDGSFKGMREVEGAVAALERAKVAVMQWQLTAALARLGPGKSGALRSLADFRWEWDGGLGANRERVGFVLAACTKAGQPEACELALRACDVAGTLEAGEGEGGEVVPAAVRAAAERVVAARRGAPEGDVGG